MKPSPKVSFGAAAKTLGREFALVGGLLGLVTVLGLVLFPNLSSMSIGLLYLLAIVAMSLRVGRWPMFIAGVGSAVVWEFFFVPPRFALQIGTFQDTLMVAIYLVVAIVAGQAAARIRAQTRRERLAAESERLHRTLLESVSHELRTPLAVIAGGLEHLSDPANVGKSDVLIAEMRSATERLDRRVGNLLDQSRLEAGTLRPRLDWCDPNDLVRAAISGAQTALAGHALTVSIPDELPVIRADFGLTEHALSNLVHNAGFHTPAGTEIDVDAGRTSDGARFFLRVSDRGPGIPESLRGRLFEKFSRGERSPAGGLGLGLSIARGFVAAQGGELVAEVPQGGGAAFTIYLPHYEPELDPGP
jgi:K+-sensing histidine kinase KdpD